MNIEVQKSKILRATILHAHLNFISSVSIGDDLVEASNFVEFEKVRSVNITKGEMIETFAIRGERGTDVISPNSSSARKARIGALYSNVSFAKMESEEAKRINFPLYFLLHTTN